MRWGRAMLLLAIVGLAGVATYFWFESRKFETLIAGLRERVIAAADPAAAAIELPDIVRAYATRAGGSIGGPTSVRLRHRATLVTDQRRPPVDIEADQWLATRRTDLVWVGRGSMFGLPVSVIDSFVGGTGLLEARLAGVLPVAKGLGTDFDKGELQRYLSELPVHPDAILNNAQLRWRQIEDSVVEVSGTSRTGPASVRLSFDASGDIVSLEAADRPMTVGSTTVPTLWRGQFSKYQQFGRYRIPSYGEVSWIFPEGPFTYWKGEIVAYEPSSAELGRSWGQAKQ